MSYKGIYQAEQDYYCALHGHQMGWITSNTNDTHPPPGVYICERCQREVEVKVAK